MKCINFGTYIINRTVFHALQMSCCLLSERSILSFLYFIFNNHLIHLNVCYAVCKYSSLHIEDHESLKVDGLIASWNICTTVGLYHFHKTDTVTIQPDYPYNHLYTYILCINMTGNDISKHWIWLTCCNASLFKSNPEKSELFISMNGNQIQNTPSNVVRMFKCPDSKVRGASMRPTCDLSAPYGPHVGPMNLAIRDIMRSYSTSENRPRQKFTLWPGCLSNTHIAHGRNLTSGTGNYHLLVGPISGNINGCCHMTE